MLRIKLLVSVLAVMLMAGLVSQSAPVRAAGPPEMVVLVVDRDSVGRTSGGADLVESLVGLVSVLRSDHFFMYVNADDPSEMLGPMLPEDQRFTVFKSRLNRELTSPPVSGHWKFADALARVYNYLSDEGAAQGSTVYLVTGGSSQPDLSELADAPGPIVGLLAQNGWPIVGLSLPGSSADVAADLRDLSLHSGGTTFELSVPDGLASLSDNVLTTDARGSLDVVSEDVADLDTVLTSFVTIAPGTDEATILFFKQSAHGSLRLSNPLGLEASAGDRSSPSVIETPHVVIWRLSDPAPGRWKVDVQGIDGNVSIWQSTLNKYSIGLEQMGAVPVGRPTILIASVRDRGQRAALEGVKVSAVISSPESSPVTYELNDEGRDGDLAAGDGFFSATVSAISQAGEHLARLDLHWPEYDHRITSESTIVSQAFPVIDLITLPTDDLRPGERTAVARLEVNVDGQPYAVPVDAIVSSMSSNARRKGALEVKPRELVSSNRAWLYDVFFTSEEPGGHTLIFHLETEYADRQYVFSTDSFVVPVLPPPLSPRRQPVAAQAPPAPAAVSQVVTPDPETEEPSSFPWEWAVAGLGAVAMIVIGGALLRMSLPRPYGFLYDDRNKLVVDFSAVRRNPLTSFLRDTLPGKATAVQGLEGVTFRFWRNRVGITRRQDAPTIRINSQPLVGEAIVEEQAWIGSGGRLYSFQTSPLPDTGASADA